MISFLVEFLIEFAATESNPFKNKGTLINSMEMLYGVPVGNHDNNIIEIKKTYQKDTDYKVKGKFRKAGETELNKIGYIYNKQGYPVTITRIRNGKKVDMTLTYECS